VAASSTTPGDATPGDATLGDAPPRDVARGRVSPWRHALLAWVGAALAGAPAAGCRNDCVGAGCEADFAAARVGVFRGSEDMTEGERSPDDADWIVEGTLALGPDWGVALLPGLLVTGSPDESGVRAFVLGEATEIGPEDRTVLLTSDDPDIRLGADLDAVPDMDGDGLPELIVGAPQDARSGLSRHDGGAWLLRGSTLIAGGEQDAGTDALAIIVGDDEGAELGRVVAGCADLDGDGLGDAAMAAPLDSSRDTLAGRVAVLLSSDLPNLNLRDTVQALPHRYTGEGVGALAGSSLDCRSDLDGDGLADLVVGAPFADGDREAEGAIYVLNGGVMPNATTLSVAATRVLTGLGPHHWAGWAVATGDLDGDGRADLAVGAPGALVGSGMVMVWRGQTVFAQDNRFPDFRLFGAQAGDGFGRSLQIEDVDGDGLGDLLIGAPRRNPAANGAPATFDSGALYLFRGSTDFAAWRPNLTVEQADAVWEEPRQFLRTGQRIAAGDVDGDGSAELAVLNRFAPE
jgi:hypothetical protein